MPNCNTFLVTEAERNMSSDDGDFNNTENRAVFKFLPARQFAEGNSRLCYRNNKGNYTIVSHRQKLRGPV